MGGSGCGAHLKSDSFAEFILDNDVCYAHAVRSPDEYRLHLDSPADGAEVAGVVPCRQEDIDWQLSAVDIEGDGSTWVLHSS